MLDHMREVRELVLLGEHKVSRKSFETTSLRDLEDPWVVSGQCRWRTSTSEHYSKTPLLRGGEAGKTILYTKISVIDTTASSGWV